MMLDADEEKLVNETEHLMNIVVEMRKIHGAACIEHSKKSSKRELDLFHHTLDVVSKTNFKGKSVRKIDVEEQMKELKEFDTQVNTFCKRVDELEHRAKNVKMVVRQMQSADPVLVGGPVTPRTVIARTKNRNKD